MASCDVAAPAPHAVHEDEALLVLVKPAGLLCVPGRGPDKQDCLIVVPRKEGYCR